MTVVFFGIIAVLRVVQTFCGKTASTLVRSDTMFFRYGTFYQLVATALGLISLFFYGFSGFDLPTALCALAAAAFFALDLYAGIECVKGGTLVLSTMFANGGLFIPCIVGIFLFDEPMSLFQWGGLALFLLSTYLLVSGSKQVYKRFSLRTLVMLALHLVASGAVMVVQKVFGLLVAGGNPAAYSFLTFGFHALIMAAGLLIVRLRKRRKPLSGYGKEREWPDEREEGSPVEGGGLRMPKKLALCGALLAVALFGINLLVLLLSSVPSVILFTVSSAISVLMTCAVGALAFREKLTFRNILGLACGFASVVVIGVL